MVSRAWNGCHLSHMWGSQALSGRDTQLQSTKGSQTRRVLRPGGRKETEGAVGEAGPLKELHSGGCSGSEAKVGGQSLSAASFMSLCA